jgi:hypothetical protein
LTDVVLVPAVIVVGMCVAWRYCPVARLARKIFAAPAGQG